jgi:tetratricopeptide (TPR) repeat protein
MADPGPHGIDVEGAIIDADLLVKYRLVNRAIESLQEAIKAAPRHVGLREKLREIFIDSNRLGDAAQMCMDLSSLYIAVEKFELANERLLEAKRLDPRVSITARLNQLESGRGSGPPQPDVIRGGGGPKSITGDLSDISIFDIVQILENSRMTGALALRSGTRSGNVYFNEGQVVDAVYGQKIALDAFAELVDFSTGQFEFEKSPTRFQQRIEASSNTSLILDILREKDEDRHGGNATDELSMFGE